MKLTIHTQAVNVVCVIWTLLLAYTCSLPCGTFQDSPTTLMFYCDGLDFSTNSSNPTDVPFLDFQGLRYQLNVSNGQFQVKETANGNVVWGWGNANENCKSCHLVFQCDGNLVLYYANGASIGSSTYNQDAAFVVFTTTPPYVTIVSSTCAQLWPTTASKPSLGPLPRSTPVLGPTFDVTEPKFSFLPASAWRSHFGVNTHCSQGWNSAMVFNLTTYVGASAIRDSIPSSGQVADYKRMFADGIRLNVVAGGAPNKSVLNEQVVAWGNFQTSTIPGMLLHIEGFNEINNFGFTYNGVNPKTSYSGMAQAMRDLYTLVKSNSQLTGIPVIDLTGGNFEDGARVGLTSYIGHADYGNVHNYAYAGAPAISIGGTLNLFLLGLGGTYPSWQNPTSNYAMTEIGYHTDNFTNGVTEKAAGILIVNTLLSGLQSGFVQTYIYELWDETWSGYDGPESHFGLFNHDETPKIAARALHFLSQLLRDAGSPPGPSTSSFTLTGLPVGAQYLLFQNNLGTLFLVLWSTAPVYNPVTKSDLPATLLKVTLSVSWSTTLNVFDIYSTTADDTKPLPPILSSQGQSVSFTMGNQAIVISYGKSTNLATAQDTKISLV